MGNCLPVIPLWLISNIQLHFINIEGNSAVLYCVTNHIQWIYRRPKKSRIYYWFLRQGTFDHFSSTWFIGSSAQRCPFQQKSSGSEQTSFRLERESLERQIKDLKKQLEDSISSKPSTSSRQRQQSSSTLASSSDSDDLKKKFDNVSKSFSHRLFIFLLKVNWHPNLVCSKHIIHYSLIHRGPWKNIDLIKHSGSEESWDNSANNWAPY